MAGKKRFIHNTDIGQNFLIDASVAEYMAKRADVKEDDVILEIGPGEGALTRPLLARLPKRLYAVELDRRLLDGLSAIAGKDGRFVPFMGDAVCFDYSAALEEAPTKIIANLPYHITTPLMWTFLEKLAPLGTEYMLLMVQQEYAERMSASCGCHERSPLGITVEAMGSAAIVRKVPPSAFRPQPRVNSAIIELKIEKNRTLANDADWRELLSKSFAQRRKTLANNWAAGYPALGRDGALSILSAHGLSATARAEELSLEKWFALAKEPYFCVKKQKGCE